ncbi:Glutamyl-tRNA(Gln) amidotransferase subunit A [Roseivivax jejudonensis]|uniref:Glutamyl-tRNA(Gln) amidotransferase subunit A n=1 Tax=Roseivivax jejudonensis TaxID=1529041 RepID=A0A1X6YEV0_9RHOB|nr:amidase family protein [Roseivivax jejudonensis]SLN19322.1 Glutamyl-tRNA(Gln) amidotransferase subunit A [Roseivivax jejudonensis]
MDEWRWLSAADLGRGIGAGRIDPVELHETFLGAIEAHPHAGRIYARTTPERGRAEARAAARRARAGTRLSPLDGVPVSWKDLFDSAGVATEAGSRLLAGRVPDRDAAVLRTATAMGLVCLGKTHMSELAFSGLGLNPKTATSPNVHDPDRVAGGSSSGAAASVAFGLAAAAIGSDTGGSVRVPSAWNDLAGLKTTAGRVSCDGLVPLAERFDTVGPLCRTVEDCALVLAALEGRLPPDLGAMPGLADRRFAALTTCVLDDLRAEPASAYHESLDRLRAAGAQVEEVAAPELEGPMAESGALYTTEACGIWGEQIATNGTQMFAPIRARFEAGADVSGSAYVAAWRRLEAARRQWAARMGGYDAVLCPTVPSMPPDIERLMGDGPYYVTENLLALRNTRVANLMGLCAVTLPTGAPSCGLSLMGGPGEEARLLHLARGVEATLSERATH